MFLFPSPPEFGVLEVPTDGQRRAIRTLAPFVPSDPVVVQAMLDLAEVGPEDFLMDLGCGDGRIVFEATKRGARALGVDIDPVHVTTNRERLDEDPAYTRASFTNENILTVDITDATVVTCYLLTTSMQVLRPKFETQLRRGTRIVSHAFSLGDWEPVKMAYSENRLGTIYLWIV